MKVQEYLDKTYPKHERENITELNLFDKDLEGALDLTEFVNLKSLYCPDGIKKITLGSIDNKSLNIVYSIDIVKNELKSFDYDVNAWKLVNVPLQIINSPEELIEKFRSKISETWTILEGKQKDLQEGNVSSSAISALERIGRLESKLSLLRKKLKEIVDAYSRPETKVILADRKRLKEELKMEREEAAKALEKAKEWRERQLKEITTEKEQQIRQLEADLKQEKEARELVEKENNELKRKLQELKDQVAYIEVSPR